MRLFDQFGELLLDSFASQVFGDDLAFGRDQEVGRDAADSVLFDDRGALAVGDGDYVGPRHLLFYKEFFPTLGIVVERYAVNVESFGAELLERLLQIGQFAAAGTAPGCPEVDQHPFAGADEGCHRNGFAQGVGQRDFQIGLADFGIFLGGDRFGDGGQDLGFCICSGNLFRISRASCGSISL